ncbi:MAG: hypothetical protein KatS3mg051_1063 [Anaerolineae bacterium]|nr:MAG: hypothetical protein KatS3mg051_1063 [Anaerolineae bacterium]
MKQEQHDWMERVELPGRPGDSLYRRSKQAIHRTRGGRGVVGWTIEHDRRRRQRVRRR